MPDITIDLEGGAAGTPAQKLEQVIGAIDHLPDDGPLGASSTATIVGAFVPIVVFVAIAVIYCAKYYFAHRSRREVQATVRAAIERGEALTPDLLDRLIQPPAPPRTDLRRGVVGIGLGIGIAAFGIVLGNPEAVRPMLAVGLVPLLLGLAYLVLWRVSGDKARN